jgi:hypothetical protein
VSVVSKVILSALLFRGDVILQQQSRAAMSLSNGVVGNKRPKQETGEASTHTTTLPIESCLSTQDIPSIGFD